VKPCRLAYFCEKCFGVFHSTSKVPERCTLCGSLSWHKPKKYKNDHDLFPDYDATDLDY
jgi:hypothetical protein